MREKWVILVFVAMSVSSICYGQRNDSLLVMFWNMENFFDYIDDGEGESDREFSSFGSRRWTKSKFNAKRNAVVKSIYWLADKYGRLPDVIGMAEIENARVLNRLLKGTTLTKADYGIIHYDSGDRRGIDVAILYRREILSKESVSLRKVLYDGDTLDTRDILHARLSGSSGTYDFIVNHHPSKYGGSIVSEGKRTAAVRSMLSLCDSLLKPECKASGIVVMGDFNDTPDSRPLKIIGDMLVNKADSLYAAGEGTIRYEGKWELIDMFLVSPELEELTYMYIERIPFLMTYDKGHAGEKPLRTYIGPRYAGGVSDHCPILLWIFEPI